VVHFELPADDVERAQAFYRATTPTDEQGRPAAPGGINGGMLTRQHPITAPIVTIGVDDIDAALATVERLGGTVALGRRPVGDMGFSAYFTDPEGNVVGLWQNA
jgi:predicted enzyme related to lactoylglutathione lyase